MLIEVTQAHIDKGERKKPCRCPIALAVKDATQCDTAEVTGIRVWLHGGDGDTRMVLLPDPCALFVAMFDDGEPVKPFTFDLTLDAGGGR